MDERTYSQSKSPEPLTLEAIQKLVEQTRMLRAELDDGKAEVVKRVMALAEGRPDLDVELKLTEHAPQGQMFLIDQKGVYNWFAACDPRPRDMKRYMLIVHPDSWNEFNRWAATERLASLWALYL